MRTSWISSLATNVSMTTQQSLNWPAFTPYHMTSIIKIIDLCKGIAFGPQVKKTAKEGFSFKQGEFLSCDDKHTCMRNYIAHTYGNAT